MVVLLLGGPAQVDGIDLCDAVLAAAEPGQITVLDGRSAFGLEDYLQGGWPDVKQVRSAALAGGLSSQAPTLQKGSVAAAANREAMLQSAQVILAGFPYPLDLRARAPRLQWVHSLNAGASNFRQPFQGAKVDLWGALGLSLTTSRGMNGSLPIAEYALAAILMWAKNLPQGFQDAASKAFSPRPVYSPILVRGKTVGIVGLGGIGRHVAQLCSAVGMEVIATRRSALAPDEAVPEGVGELLQSSDLPRLLAAADFVVVPALAITIVVSVSHKRNLRSHHTGIYLRFCCAPKCEVSKSAYCWLE